MYLYKVEKTTGIRTFFVASFDSYEEAKKHIDQFLEDDFQNYVFCDYVLNLPESKTQVFVSRWLEIKDHLYEVHPKS